MSSNFFDIGLISKNSKVSETLFLILKKKDQVLKGQKIKPFSPKLNNTNAIQKQLDLNHQAKLNTTMEIKQNLFRKVRLILNIA